jgi:hypothetical protein
MKTITVTTNTYTFPELSDKAKDKARECYHNTYMSDEHWHEFIIDDAKEVGKLLGFDVERIHFSGFSSQGDGASWAGGYEYAKGAPAAVASYTGNDAELIRIAHGLQDIQRRHFYQLTASISTSGRYSHSHTMRADVEDRTDPYRDVSDAEKDLLELFRDFADWIYKNLREEHEFMTSDPVIAEAFDANDVAFDVNGNVVR